MKQYTKGYRKRSGAELVALATTIGAQTKADLVAIAQAAGMSIGEAMDALVRKEVQRRELRLQKHLDDRENI